MPGTFIVFEGPDGSGKSSMVAAARSHLAEIGVPATFVRDPGGTSIGGRIREVLLDAANSEMCAMTELLLYVASRAQLVEETIRPALERGEVVVSDRFTLSTLVYQGVAGALPKERLAEVVCLGVEEVQPDCVLLLDVPAEVGLERVGASRDRMEQKGLEFFRAVRQGYLDCAGTMGAERVRMIDASRPVEAVRADVLAALDAALGTGSGEGVAK